MSSVEFGNRKALVSRGLTIVSLLLIALYYFAPIWWVSLEAPNYPKHTFPEGVRIHFHLDKVANGCKIRESTEVLELEALDCVHEMNTINHYIGMEPIEKGAQLEQAAAPYIMTAVGLLLVVFLFYAGPLYWLLPVPAILVPVGFVIDYAYWLWWFGHNLHPWGAFTVKPFMPTVFGDGKVAQFTTHSYPHYGFSLMVLSAVLLILAVLIRRKQLRDQRQDTGDMARVDPVV